VGRRGDEESRLIVRVFLEYSKNKIKWRKGKKMENENQGGCGRKLKIEITFYKLKIENRNSG
jgi:hypothetical protein